VNFGHRGTLALRIIKHIVKQRSGETMASEVNCFDYVVACAGSAGCARRSEAK
jgi:hypothetical protein